MNPLRPFTGRSRTLNTEEASTSRTNTLNNTNSSTWLNRLASRNNRNTQILEQIIDTDRDIEIMTNDYITTLNPNTLYQSGIFENKSSLIKTHRSEILAIPDGKTENFGLITQEGIIKLKKKNMNFLHLGLITVGIRGLIRKQSGTKVMIVALDTRNQNSLQSQIIGLIEVDMNNNVGIYHLCPDYTVDIKDIHKIKFQVQTKGFGNFQGSNLVIDVIFLGKLSSQFCPRYNIKIDGIVKAIESKGIKFFGPQPISSAILAGEEWKIENTITQPETLKPTEVVTYCTENNGPLMIRFKNYETSNQQDLEDNES